LAAKRVARKRTPRAACLALRARNFSSSCGPVYLEIWVKVKSGWADNEAGLRAYGYE
jgi:hypothetical protein